VVTSRSSSSKSEALASGPSATENGGSSSQIHARAPSKVSTLQLGDANGGLFSDQHGSEIWMEEPPVESPISYPVDEQRSGRPVGVSNPPLQKKSFSALSHAFKASSSSFNTHPPSIDSEPSDSGNPPSRMPSKVRWEQLRQHVMVAPLPASPPLSARVLPILSRPHTPKLSRFPRLGFRQVVEHAREAAVDDSRGFADELLQICWSARIPDSVRQGKHERDGTLGVVSSSLHLPFVSSTTLNSFATGSTLVQAPTIQKAFHMKRPPSTMSAGPDVAPVVLLHDAILRYASKNTTHLPHETLVLSTLLKPFLSSESNQNLDEDQWTAIEAFEVAVKTWQPTSDDVRGHNSRFVKLVAHLIVDYCGEVHLVLRSCFHSLLSSNSRSRRSYVSPVPPYWPHRAPGCSHIPFSSTGASYNVAPDTRWPRCGYHKGHHLAASQRGVWEHSELSRCIRD
jgi:hypothetical protein